MPLYRFPAEGMAQIKGVSSCLKIWIKGSRSSDFKLRKISHKCALHLWLLVPDVVKLTIKNNHHTHPGQEGNPTAFFVFLVYADCPYFLK